MLFTQDRNQLRKVYFQSWQKFKKQQPMEPMETLIAELISQHPEYQPFFEQTETNQHKDFTPEMGQTNPFLHLGMHIAIHEQLGTHRPAEIAQLYRQLCAKTGDQHSAEHQIMDCLGEMLWSAQKNNQAPNENTYIECIKKLL